jgi:hypothetical protein
MVCELLVHVLVINIRLDFNNEPSNTIFKNMPIIVTRLLKACFLKKKIFLKFLFCDFKLF